MSKFLPLLAKLPVDTYDVKIELIEPLLGTVPKDPSVYATYILAKQTEEAIRKAKRGYVLADGEAVTADAMATRNAEELVTCPTGNGEAAPVPVVQEVDEDDGELSAADREERGWTGQ